jgi:Na+-transporting NADH:ubiquinone oxidoreductase subunit A
MVHIKIKKGLDIPIQGSPSKNPSPELASLIVPTQVSLNLSAFEGIKFRLLVKAGDVVKIGQPLAEDKGSPGRMFASPAAGVIKEIRRGHKRVLKDIVIDVAKKEDYATTDPLSPGHATREQIIEKLKAGGFFANIRSRPFNILADPNQKPKSIFVKAVESAPFIPPADLQVVGHEKEFQTGLTALTKLTDGPVHLVYGVNRPFQPFSEAANVQIHTVEGPHPSANSSLHIQKIDRILSSSDIVWTLNAQEVVAIGHYLITGRYFIDRVIGIAGPGMHPQSIGFFKGRAGYPIGALIAGRIPKGLFRFISGDPLMGTKVTAEDFLGYSDYAFCVIPENTSREFMHFFRLGLDKYTYSGAYMSGHLDNKNREYEFTTNQHGEHRFFIDSTLYDDVMPLEVPTMLLVKAVMAEDFELADIYGLLEVDAEDFALPTFVCPSKMEMVEIMKRGIRQYAQEILQ